MTRRSPATRAHCSPAFAVAAAALLLLWAPSLARAQQRPQPSPQAQPAAAPARPAPAGPPTLIAPVPEPSHVPMPPRGPAEPAAPAQAPSAGRTSTMTQPAESDSPETRLRRLADHLAAGVRELPGQARYQRFGVLRFEEAGKRTRKEELGTLVTAMLVAYLVRDHGVPMVERDRLDDVLGELKLGVQLGQVEAQKVGQLANAQALILGEVSDAGDHFLVTARVVAVDSGRALLSEAVDLPAGEAVRLSDEALVLRTRLGAVFRSVVLPGWGQYYNKQGVKSVAFLGTEVLLLSTALGFHISGERDRSRYQQDLRLTVSYKERGERKLVVRNVLLYVALAGWAVGVIDAYLSGHDLSDADEGVLLAGWSPPRILPVVLVPPSGDGPAALGLAWSGELRW